MSPPTIDQLLCRWMRDHHSIIGRSEAFALGAGPNDVRTRLVRGQWSRVRDGVYQDASAPLTPYRPVRVAFVALHGRAIASHATAAWLWGLLPDPPNLPEFTVPHGKGDGARGDWTTHRTRDFDRIRPALRETILVTNPLRTLVDLAGSAPPATLAKAVDVAIDTRLLTVDGLVAELARNARQGRTGVAALRRHLLDRGYLGTPAPSVLEAKIQRLIVGTGLPLPEAERRAGEEGRYRIDVAWAPILFGVEVDGYTWHFSPEAMANDNARRNRLRAAGWYLLVYTWLDIVREPARVATEITAAFHQLSRLAGTAAGGSSPPRRIPRPGPGNPAAGPARPCR